MPQHFDANAIFERALRHRKIRFRRADADLYQLVLDDISVTARLSNARRDAERTGDAAVIANFLDEVLAVTARKLPAWTDAKSCVLFSAESSAHDFGDTLRSPVTDAVCRVLSLTDRTHSFVQWLTPRTCARWNVSEAEVLAAAFQNQDALLTGISLETAEAEDGEKLGMVPLNSPYKASVIFAPSFRRLVERHLGWPVLVVIPCRDFIYALRDGSPLLGNVGHVIVDEFRASGYPLTTEVLRLSDEGIEAIGHFPT